MTIPLNQLRRCMDGAIAGVIATCAPDGTPNVSFLSQVEYVDSEHVALSFQFFNKTHDNVRQQPFASVCLIDPHTGANYTLQVGYLRTETAGSVFARMKAKLAGIASHEGMTKVFRLRGADIYRVFEVEELPGNYLPPPSTPRDLLAALRSYGQHLAACNDLDEVLDRTLQDLDTLFGIERGMILIADEAGDALFTIASRGYEYSGAGAEIPLGQGIIGMAAAENCPIRISFTAPEYGYGRAIRERMAQSEWASSLETAIPFPGLENPKSQMAVPIVGSKQLIGVLYADSEEEMRFGHEDEDALTVLAAQLGAAIASSSSPSAQLESIIEKIDHAQSPKIERVNIRHYEANSSVFIEDDYLIKGVAGEILWVLLKDFQENGKTNFSNRELRLDPRLRLPDYRDNLEARLVLLKQRLQDKKAPVQIEKSGRGKFSLVIDASLALKNIPHEK